MKESSDDQSHRTSGRRTHFTRVILIALLLSSGIAMAVFAYRLWFSTYHLATVREGVLYRDGSRNCRELLRAVKQTGTKTVVSLIDDKELSDPAKPQFASEGPALRGFGCAYERIPVKLGGYPSSDDLQRFLFIAEDPRNQPVLLHCAQGVRRTAMFVAAYQESVLGWDKARAKAAIVSFGHRGRTIDDIERFIDAYSPDSRTLTTRLDRAERQSSKPD